MPVATSVQWRQLKISPDIVKRPLVGKTALVENHFEMQFMCWKNHKSQGQENKSPLYSFGQVTLNLGLQFLPFWKETSCIRFIHLFVHPSLPSFIHSFNKCFVSSCYVPGTLVGVRDRAVTSKIPALKMHTFKSSWETGNTQRHKNVIKSQAMTGSMKKIKQSNLIESI